jgi:hypothetical protein
MKEVRINMEEIVMQGDECEQDIRTVNSYPSKVTCSSCRLVGVYSLVLWKSLRLVGLYSLVLWKSLRLVGVYSLVLWKSLRLVI